MFAISPKLDCPHLNGLHFDQIKECLSHETVFGPCNTCENRSENWLCLSCNTVLCSRFVNGHMAEHYEETQHPVALSFSDASFWCYLCDTYVYSPELKEVEKKFQAIKFPKEEESSASASASAA